MIDDFDSIKTFLLELKFDLLPVLFLCYHPIAGEENFGLLPSTFFDGPNNYINIRQINKRKKNKFISVHRTMAEI